MMLDATYDTVQLYEVLCERMVISTRASRFASFLAITTQNLGLDDSQYIYYPITVVYMHISLMNP
jgi:hypothetical protein